MRKTDVKLLGFILCIFLLNACSSGGGDIPEQTPTTPQPAPAEKKIPINLNCGVSSRVTDSSYENGDKVGLYVVIYDGENAGTLQESGNHANNVAFSYDGSKWTSSTSLYWKDDKTKADFYAKIAIALKEAYESYYWIRLLHATDYLADKEFFSLESDIKEILAILISISNTKDNTKK